MTLLVLIPVSVMQLLPRVYEELTKQWGKTTLMQTAIFVSCIQRT